MPEIALVTLVAVATVLATGLGALPVLAVGERAARMAPWLDGLVIGVMGVAAVAGLLRPAIDEGTPVAVGAGAVAGAAGLWWARRRLLQHEGGHGDDAERARLTVGVLFVHSLPEGLALGSAMAAPGSVGAFVVLAIAAQNVPEGTATAIALLRAGASRRAQVGQALLTSAPQVPGALLAWVAVDAVGAVLPVSLAAAGAAMLLLVVVDLAPAARPGGVRSLAGVVLGGGAMLGLAHVLQAPA